MKLLTLGTVFALAFIAAAVEAQSCGRKQAVVQKLIFNGYKAQTGAWPWHGAVFHREPSGTRYVCGLTILTGKFVITAAHCTIDSVKKQDLPARRVFVKVGMTNLDSPEWHAQQHNVVKVIRHEAYNKSTAENDIALLKLYTNITFNEYVQPICLWQGDANLMGIVWKTGYVVGWGYTDKSYILSKNLNEATIPIVTRRECIESDPGFYSNVYFKQKTFCAGYRNETTLAHGDSGGGLYLPIGNSWVLRAIVSVAKTDANTQGVDAKSFIVFTDTASYAGWIRNYVTTLANYTVDEQPIPTANPSVEQRKHHNVAEKCGQKYFDVGKIISDGNKALTGAWSWHGALFLRLLDAKPFYACGVTILTDRFVVTVAHCTMDPHGRQRMPADRVYVKLGMTNLNSKQSHVQQHNVIKIVRHEEYDEEVFENDIALIKLTSKITFTDFVKPIALWQGDAKLKHIISQIGYTVGWGYNEDYGLPKELHEATMPIVARKECIKSDPTYYRRFVFEHKTFCAGHTNGTSSAPGDSGGGLFLRQGDSWVLRGIVSNMKTDPNTMVIDAKKYVVFVDVPYYEEWINENLD